jgi:hypothetical protein
MTPDYLDVQDKSWTQDDLDVQDKSWTPDYLKKTLTQKQILI